ncbi:hypothetical protein IEQ34_005216 [Dendrobium chrysotoxum]|uniref:Uncharacterized protein n=1 Tax=Dendrobium chrysotoxum TaxID=161865 RepID=A0AAV7HC08_DENCH|nr:hypothetical protein IEQ34_005216 [Dendrobium chrysotoxum]
MVELLHRSELMKRAREVTLLSSGSREKFKSRTSQNYPMLKEALWLHPPAPFLLPHKVEVSTEINGYMVSKNTLVMVNVWLR